jgi:hypothetical protein
MNKTTIDLDMPQSAEERVRATRVLSIPEQIERAIRFQREIIKAAEAEIARLQGIRV